MALTRKTRAYFKQINGDRFLSLDKPTQDTYNKLFESVAFISEVSDTAKEGTQGLVKSTSDENAIKGTIVFSDVVTRTVRPHQLPVIQSTNNAIVVTPKVYNESDDVIEGIVAGFDFTTLDSSKAYRIAYVIEYVPTALNGTWHNVGSGDSFDGSPLFFNTLPMWDGLVPGFTTPGTTTDDIPFQVRVLAENKIAFRGNYIPDSPWVSGSEVLQLPFGPDIDQQFMINGDGAGGYAVLKTDGKLIINGFEGFEIIRFQEVELTITDTIGLD